MNLTEYQCHILKIASTAQINTLIEITLNPKDLRDIQEESFLEYSNVKGEEDILTALDEWIEVFQQLHDNPEQVLELNHSKTRVLIEVLMEQNEIHNFDPKEFLDLTQRLSMFAKTTPN